MPIHQQLSLLVSKRAKADGCKAPEIRRQLAAKCEVSPDFVYQWCVGIRPIPAAHATNVEHFFDGALARHEIAPKVFKEAA